MSQYSYFGDANPLTPDIVDPVEQCVGNTFFTKTGIAGGYMQKDFCPRFMAQRCATKWDDYCEAFLKQSDYDMGGYIHLNKDFLEETARKKYCRLNTEASGVQCSRKCEALNPEGQNSVSICENIGVQNWMDTKKQFDLAGDFPQSAKLTPVSPLYMDRCPEICDAKDSPSDDSLGPNDMVLNKCIEHGACNNILADLSYNAVKDSLNVTNPAFQKLIEYSKLNVPININNAIKIAKNQGIPPAVALEVVKTAKYGENDVGNPVLSSGDKGSVLEASPEQLQQVQTDSEKIAELNNKIVEQISQQQESPSIERFDSQVLKSEDSPVSSPVSSPTPTMTPKPKGFSTNDIIIFSLYAVLIGLLLYLLFYTK